MKNTPSFTAAALSFAKSFGTFLLNLCLRVSYTASLSDAQNYRFLKMGGKKKKKKMGGGKLCLRGKEKMKKKKKRAKLCSAREPGSFACVRTHHFFPVSLFNLSCGHNRLNKQKKPSTNFSGRSQRKSDSSRF